MNLVNSLLLYLTVLSAGALNGTPNVAPTPALTTPIVASAAPTQTIGPANIVVPPVANSEAPAKETKEPKTNIVIKSGDKGTLVRDLQKRLKELGYFNAKIDGVFGKKTRSALVAFQKKNSLNADGVAGQKTLKKLYNDPNVVSAGQKANSATETPKIKPKTSLVIMFYLDENGAELYRKELVFQQGKTTVAFDESKLPEGYELSSARTVTVEVDAKGKATPSEVVFKLVKKQAPTDAPTEIPTEAPTEAPEETEAPTEAPEETETPTEAPTEAPEETETPTEAPTEAPENTEAPTEAPNEAPEENNEKKKLLEVFDKLEELKAKGKVTLDEEIDYFMSPSLENKHEESLKAGEYTLYGFVDDFALIGNEKSFGFVEKLRLGEGVNAENLKFEGEKIKPDEKQELLEAPNVESKKLRELKKNSSLSAYYRLGDFAFVKLGEGADSVYGFIKKN